MPTLYIWGALDPTPALAAEEASDAPAFALPTLDPPSLYAASLLRLVPSVTPLELRLCTPSPILHRTVPRLEFGGDDYGEEATLRSATARTDVLEGLQPIESYARTPSAAQLRHSVDDAFVRNDHAKARATALHAVITHQLEPLALHALFSHPANFRFLGVRTYSYTPDARPPSTVMQKTGHVLAAPVHIRPQLRTSVQAQLVRHGIWGLAGSAEEEREREKRAKKSKRLGKDVGEVPGYEGPSRVPLGGSKEAQSGLKRSTKKEMELGWDKAKLTALAKGPLDVLNASLTQNGSGNDRWLLGASSPTSLDAHLFSALAPILFSSPLPDSAHAEISLPLASLLRANYPTLVEHSARFGRLLWAVQPRAPTEDDFVPEAPVAASSSSAAAPVSGASATEWEWQPHGRTTIHVPSRSRSSTSGAGGSGITLRSAASYLASSAYAAPSAAWSSVRSYFSSAPSSSGGRRANADGDAFTRPENLGWGRVIWISSAVVGFISFLFVSGIIQVQYVDVEEGEEGEEGGEEEGEEEGNDEREIDEEEKLREEGEDDEHELEAREGEEEEEEEEEEDINNMYVEDDFDDDDDE
ncbi:hypothetical protein OC835_005516 [Tilletia horrida]|nr:hypothetical protein OC835_005516 [Tilletia horrida]